VSNDPELPDAAEAPSVPAADSAPATGQPDPATAAPVRRSPWRRVVRVAEWPWWAAVGGVVTVLVGVLGLVVSAIPVLFPDNGGPDTAPPAAQSPSAKPVGPPSPGATANPDEVPFGVSLVYDQNHVDNGAAIPGCGGKGKWVFPQEVGAIPQPAKLADLDETWAHQNGGVDYGETSFKLDIQGKESSAVNLVGIRLVDVRKSPGVAGPLIVTQLGCGEPDKGNFKIILDPPDAMLITSVAGHDFPYTTSDSDISQLQIKAGFGRANRPEDLCGCVVSWRLAIDWTYKGQVGAPLIVDNQGKPFQTRNGAQVGTWTVGDGAWLRAE
jgi:hypothetical protein